MGDAARHNCRAQFFLSFHYLIWINIDDFCCAKHGLLGFQVVFVKMGVAMKMAARPGGADEPVQGLQAIMRRVQVVMNSERRRMADEDIHCAAMSDAVYQQLWKHLKGALVGFGLGVLVDAVGPVTDAAAKAADQNIFMVRSFQVQV